MLRYYWLKKNIIKLLSQKDNFGIYHYSDEGNISWFDFASEIYKMSIQYDLPVDADLKLNAISESEYPSWVSRPKYSIFDKSKIKEKLKFETIDWKENLESFFNEFL